MPRFFYLQHNLSTFRRQPLSELSGALGDLGTFLPILLSLSASHQISLTTTLVLTGVYNIATGVLFGIPLPVQPMKAIAAVALLRGLSATEVAAAGIFVGGTVGLMAITGLLRWFNDWIPVPVVKGVQVGAGLSLIIAGGRTILGLGWTSPSWADNWIWVFAAFLFLLLVSSSAEVPPDSESESTSNLGGSGPKGGTKWWQRIPYALTIFLLGVLFAILRIVTSPGLHLPHFHFWHGPSLSIPLGSSTWITGISSAGIGQLPLTTLNSIIAVVQLASDLHLPHSHAGAGSGSGSVSVTVTSIGLSVTTMNLLGCWFGCMPTCHGSGGLAAQHRFGARSGASIMILGAFKLVIALVFGESLSDLLERFPRSFLAVMVIGAGLELAGVGESLNTVRARDISGKDRQQHHQAGDGATAGLLPLPVPPARGVAVLSDAERKRRWTVMLVTVGGLVAFRNDAVGFLAGMLCHWSYGFPRLIRRIGRRRREGRIRLPGSASS